MPLLLSPAGTFPALKAAIDAGADEVYLGGSMFNARMNADNFDKEGLKKASRLCKNSNVNMHITLNTLIYDREFKSVLEYVDFLANDINPDALIIQDFGLLKVVRENYPDIPVHASTQMRIHSPEDAKYLKSLGVSRAVLARELPIEDISEFVKTGLETEIFVHGAICVSESGGCLMSSVIGNRSGNRGECAQPCRLPYRTKNRFPLSLKDMCLANHIPEITKSGVTSLKIEGRMKSPEYVGTVTSVYRRLIDENRIATGKELELLANIFSRSGFTDGYFVSKITPDMFGVRSETDKQKSNKTSFNIPKAEKRKEKEAKPDSIPFVLPERDESKVLHPAKQKGIVLRFEGRLPSEALLAKYAENVARIDIPLDNCTDKHFLPYKEKISAVLPRTVFLKERDRVIKQLRTAKEFGIKHATVSSLNQIDLCEGFWLHGDYAFNIVNRETIAFLERYPFSSLMISPETDGRFPKGSKCALEYIGYGRTPLMYTRTCIIKNIAECKHKEKCFAVLTDRTGATFPIISAPNHTNIIYNSLAGYRLDRKSELKKSGIGLMTLLFTDESEKRIEEIITLAQNGGKPNFEYTRR